MAGSLTYRKYESDDGSDYSIRVDKSHADSTVVGGSVILCPKKTEDVPTLDKGIKPRYVLCHLSSDPLKRKKIIIGSKALVETVLTVGTKLSLLSEGQDEGTSAGQWIITYYSGERFRLPPAWNSGDTGLVDNDGNQ